MRAVTLPENNKLVLRAFATLVDLAPKHSDYNAHLQFIQDFGKEHYLNYPESSLCQLQRRTNGGLESYR